MNLFLVLLLFYFSAKNAALSPSDITGTWLTAGDDSAKVLIYRQDRWYNGKIVWLQKPTENGKPRLDDKNPDTENRNNPVIGIVILKDFVWNEDDKQYDSGSVYDPASGNTYSGYIRMISKDQIKLWGYIGISLIGRTEYWTRVE